MVIIIIVGLYIMACDSMMGVVYDDCVWSKMFEWYESFGAKIARWKACNGAEMVFYYRFSPCLYWHFLCAIRFRSRIIRFPSATVGKHVSSPLVDLGNDVFALCELFWLWVSEVIALFIDTIWVLWIIECGGVELKWDQILLPKLRVLLWLIKCIWM